MGPYYYFYCFTMEEVRQQLLFALDKTDGINSLDYSNEKNVDHNQIIGAIKSLQASEMVIGDFKDKKVNGLTKDGEVSAEKGSAEARLWEIVGTDGMDRGEAEKKMGKAEFKSGFGYAMKSKWVRLDKATKKVTREKDSINDEVKAQLQSVKNGETVDEAVVKNLMKRKMVSQKTVSWYEIKKGPKFSTSFKKDATVLTKEMITSGSWKDEKFKPYNFNAMGLNPNGGYLHPLLKVRSEFRQIFLEMGFQEMPTSQYVENGFWNFDSLFQPQQHPARDAHDTFFIKEPAESLIEQEEYCEKVRQTHENGGDTKSIGWRYNWEMKEAKRNILRTHTTAVSARMLYKLANQEGGFKPVKYFSIDRVFRNETLDATHLAEFHQIEGLIADRGLTLGDLMGIIQTFFENMGVKNIKFKPAYNPYTEPSMEVFGFHPGLKQWVELGNSGIFRPEMILPMGLPDDVRVIAWGLSLERPTMIKYGISNIRSLCGHRLDLNFVKNNPIVRF